MNYMLWLSLGIAIVAVGHSYLYSQTLATARPYVATVKRTVFVRGPGNVETVKSVETRTEARDRLGRRYTSANSGTPERFRLTTVHDIQTGRVYQVDHANRRVFVAAVNEFRRGPDLTALTGSQREDIQSRTRRMGEVSCVESPVYVQSGDGTRSEAGKGCTSFELGALTIAQDYTAVRGGQQLRTVTELVDLRMDVEPNPDWFLVPEAYATIQGSAWNEREARR